MKRSLAILMMLVLSPMLLWGAEPKELTLQELNAALAANPELTQAMYLLGVAYENGIGVPRDEVKAADLYRQAWKNGNQKALEHLNALYGTAVADAQLTPEERSRRSKQAAAAPAPNQVQARKAAKRSLEELVQDEDVRAFCTAAGLSDDGCAGFNTFLNDDVEAEYFFLVGSFDQYVYEECCCDIGLSGEDCARFTAYLESDAYMQQKEPTDDETRGMLKRKITKGNGSLIRALRSFAVGKNRSAAAATATDKPRAATRASCASRMTASRAVTPPDVSPPPPINPVEELQKDDALMNEFVTAETKKLKEISAKAAAAREKKRQAAPSRALRDNKPAPGEAKGKEKALSVPGTPHALVIGINSYKKINKLENAVNDAKDVANLLAEQYGFQTRVILEEQATRDNIMIALNDYRKQLTENDSLLIYYSGHGEFNKDTDTSYWLPVDADMDDTTKWLESRAIADQLKLMSSRHVLIVADSCFSGTMTRKADTSLTDGRVRVSYLEKLMTKPARVLIASGGNEPVTDGGARHHSIFADAFMKALKNPFATRFTAEELLARHLKESVAGRTEQTPEFRVIRNSGHDGGDFIFEKR